MRIRLTVAPALLAGGCATAPGTPEPVAVLAAAEEPNSIAESLDTVQEARRAGYRIVNEGGTTLYCREQLKTGSHLRKETICLTEEQLLAVREQLKRDLEQMNQRRRRDPGRERPAPPRGLRP